MVGYFCSQMWQQLCDLNGDGDVEEEEIDEMFDLADANGDGFLDEEEILAVLDARLGKDMATGVMAKRVLSVVDKNTDQKVSRDELRKALMKEFFIASKTLQQKAEAAHETNVAYEDHHV